MKKFLALLIISLYFTGAHSLGEGCDKALESTLINYEKPMQMSLLLGSNKVAVGFTATGGLWIAAGQVVAYTTNLDLKGESLPSIRSEVYARLPEMGQTEIKFKVQMISSEVMIPEGAVFLYQRSAETILEAQSSLLSRVSQSVVVSKDSAFLGFIEKLGHTNKENSIEAMKHLLFPLRRTAELPMVNESPLFRDLTLKDYFEIFNTADADGSMIIWTGSPSSKWKTKFRMNLDHMITSIKQPVVGTTKLLATLTAGPFFLVYYGGQLLRWNLFSGIQKAKIVVGDRVMDTDTNCGAGSVVSMRGLFYYIRFDNADCGTRSLMRSQFDKIAETSISAQDVLQKLEARMKEWPTAIKDMVISGPSLDEHFLAQVIKITVTEDFPKSYLPSSMNGLPILVTKVK